MREINLSGVPSHVSGALHRVSHGCDRRLGWAMVPRAHAEQKPSMERDPMVMTQQKPLMLRGGLIAPLTASPAVPGSHRPVEERYEFTVNV